MVQLLKTTLLVLTIAAGVSCQYFDLFSALQPLFQYTTTKPQYIERTTKKQNTHNTNRGSQRIENDKRTDIFNTNRENIHTPVAEIIYEQTTRRTTRNPHRYPTAINYEETTRRTTSNPNGYPAAINYEQTTKRTSNNSNRYPTAINYEETTRRTISNPNRYPAAINYEQTTKRTSSNSNRYPAAINYEQTTKRPTTTKATTNHSNRRNISHSNELNVIRNNTRDNPTINFNEENDSKNNKRQNQANRNDKIIYQDGRINTVYNYETTKSYTTKSPFIFEDSYQPNNNYVTQNPYRPGVKPAVTNGIPITNKPVTQRPYSRPIESDDTSVSPELIFGPNEDFMSSVDKKMYIDLAERMCDKYKALNIKQVEAIPLLPSPNSVKVNVSSCTPSTVPLVVGGKVVSVKEFPHMVLLGWKKLHGSGYYWKCGGSLISNQYILTAGHCAYQDRDNTVLQGPPRIVQLGSSYLNGQNAKFVKVAAVYRHPKYKQPKSYHDIAIVKLTNPVEFSDNIKPACLGVPPAVGKPVIATGWGRTEFGGDQSNELRSVSLPVWDMNECFDVLGTSRKIPDGPSSESQMCAGEKQGGKDTCQGDSGGPAQIQDGCIWRVTAVTSLGRSCGAPHTPALYALVPRAFVAAIAFDPNENKQTQIQKNTNNQNYQPNNSNYNTESNSQINNQYSNNNNVNYNNDRNNYESSSNYNQHTNNNYNSQNNQRPNYESSNNYNNNNQRNNYNDYTTQRNYVVQENNYNYNNPSRNENFAIQNDQYSDSRVWW